jgi:formylglycine-generating enzyme required for sulfatase activity
MVHVEPGKFKMGYSGPGAKPDEKPVREVEIRKGFYIDKYEVTNRQYAQFLKESHRPPPAAWKGDTYPAGEDEYPVSGVTYEDAKAYCEKRGKRLPTAEEWEYAARGPESRLYPWGNTWESGKCNSFEAGKNGPVKVGEFQGGKSWCGTYDQAGNVWEWTSTPAPGTSNVMIIRGGSFKPLEDLPRGSLTGRLPRDQARDNVGFRCVKDEE